MKIPENTSICVLYAFGSLSVLMLSFLTDCRVSLFLILLTHAHLQTDGPEKQGSNAIFPLQLCSPLSYKGFFLSLMEGLTQIVGISRITLFLVIWLEMKVSNPSMNIYTLSNFLYPKIIGQQRIYSSGFNLACGFLKTRCWRHGIFLIWPCCSSVLNYD